LQQRHHLLAVVCLAAGLALLPLVGDSPPSIILAALATYGVFVAPVLPLTEALTLEALGTERTGYGRVRLWGSLGFIAMSMGIGFVVVRFGLGTIAWALTLPLLACAVLALGLVVPTNPRPHALAPHGKINWKPLLPVLLVATLVQISHGPYYAFFSLTLTKLGASAPVIGIFWALGVAIEIFLMAFAAPLTSRFSGLHLLQFGVTAAAVRWMVLANTDSLVLIGISQMLHAGSYASVHLAAIGMVDDVMPREHRALGQSLLSASAYGVGVGVGCSVAGRLVTPWGYAGIYQTASLTCLLALAMSPWCHRAALRKGASA